MMNCFCFQLHKVKSHGSPVSNLQNDSYKKRLARRVKIEKNGYSSEAQTVTLELKLYIPVYFLTRCELNLLQIKPFLSQTSMFWTKNMGSGYSTQPDGFRQLKRWEKSSKLHVTGSNLCKQFYTGKKPSLKESEAAIRFGGMRSGISTGETF